MVCGRLVARGTIRQARMIKAGIAKIARILMACAASARIMVSRGAVAGGAICATNR